MDVIKLSKFANVNFVASRIKWTISSENFALILNSKIVLFIVQIRYANMFVQWKFGNNFPI